MRTGGNEQHCSFFHLSCFHCSSGDQDWRLLQSMDPGSLHNSLSVELEIGMKKIVEFLLSVVDWDHGQSKLRAELQHQALQCTEVLLLLQCLGGVWVLISRSKFKLPFISITHQSKGQGHCMGKKYREHEEHKWTKNLLKCLREEVLEIRRAISFRAICHIFLAEKLEDRRRFWVQFNVLIFFHFQAFSISKYNFSSFSSSKIKYIGASL